MRPVPVGVGIAEAWITGTPPGFTASVRRKRDPGAVMTTVSVLGIEGSPASARAALASSSLAVRRRASQMAGSPARSRIPDIGEYEVLTSAQIHKTRPGWLVFRDGCPGGETPEQVGIRTDRVIARARAASGGVAMFAHGHVLRALVARWIGLPASAGQHFLLDTGTLCVLGYYRDVPAVRTWNGPLSV